MSDVGYSSSITHSICTCSKVCVFYIIIIISIPLENEITGEILVHLGELLLALVFHANTRC